MNKRCLLVVAVLSGINFCAHAMHPPKKRDTNKKEVVYLIKYFDRLAPVKKRIIESFGQFVAEIDFQEGVKTEEGVKAITKVEEDDEIHITWDLTERLEKFSTFYRSLELSKKKFKIKEMFDVFLSVVEGSLEPINLKDEDLLCFIFMADYLFLENKYAHGLFARALLSKVIGHNGFRRVDEFPIPHSLLQDAVFLKKDFMIADMKGNFIVCDWNVGRCTETLLPINGQLGLRGYEEDTGFVDISPFSSVAFFSDGERIVFGCKSGNLNVFDLNEKKFVLTLRGCKERILGIVVSSDGKTILSRGPSPNILVWNAQTGENEGLLKGDQDTKVKSMVFHPDGKRVISADNKGQIFVWDLESKKREKKIKQKKAVIAMDISPNGGRLATLDSSGLVVLWNLETEKIFRKWNGQGETTLGIVRFSPRGDFFVVSGSRWNSFFVFFESGKRFESKIEKKKGIDLIGLSPDGRFCFSFYSIFPGAGIDSQSICFVWRTNAYEDFTRDQVVLCLKIKEFYKKKKEPCEIIKGSQEFEIFDSLPSFAKNALIEDKKVEIVEKK